MNKTRIFWLLVCIVIIATSLCAVWLMSVLKEEPEIKASTNQVPLVLATKASWQSTPFEISASGFAKPITATSMQAQVSGEVIYISPNLVSGGFITKNEKLVQLNPDVFAARVDELNAQLQSVDSDLVLAKQQLDRTTQLKRDGLSSQQEFDQGRANFDAAKARKIQTSAALKTAQLNLSRTSLIAPYKGRVIRETLSVGNVLSPGIVYAEIYADDAFEIVASFPEKAISLLGDIYQQDLPDIPARVEASFANQLYQWTGKLVRIEPGIDQNTRTINLIVRVEQPKQSGISKNDITGTDMINPPLFANMFTKVYLPVSSQMRYLEVPRSSIRSDGSIWYVSPDAKQQGEIYSSKVHILYSSGNIAYISAELNQLDSLCVLIAETGNIFPGNVVRVQASAQQNKADGS
ncbi:efflux RND transporter periplasmic adaptor subunit [Glaciecola petra]|uniref:Efflux RND transporter periplasmic adaptor subunit n=1 Tax=Glaciecola petra TaxID=3075602 RepID=A0ABU2ZVH5_9ALTE|nr:efflux RND transporter periplasmic adaptor subunit [Aestuariibacter sp. P117]MDT0596304.1 efflux RND transporter periplasmic adaptor subunit [Aestuariibacter sp. P117]